MNVLVACEFSGVVREAFREDGHEAWSCDLLPAEDGGRHFQADVLTLLDCGWDLLIAHPPCTYLCSSGLHWNARRPERARQTQLALDFVRMLLDAPIPRIALENPMGRIGTAIRPADQVIQPHQFGHDASKATCLWLKNLPPLEPTAHVAPRMIGGRPGGQIRPTPGRTGCHLRLPGGRTAAGRTRASPAPWPRSGAGLAEISLYCSTNRRSKYGPPHGDETPGEEVLALSGE